MGMDRPKTTADRQTLSPCDRTGFSALGTKESNMLRPSELNKSRSALGSHLMRGLHMAKVTGVRIGCMAVMVCISASNDARGQDGSVRSAARESRIDKSEYFGSGNDYRR